MATIGKQFMSITYYYQTYVYSVPTRKDLHITHKEIYFQV